jgi:hypothetical protein
MWSEGKQKLSDAANGTNKGKNIGLIGLFYRHMILVQGANSLPPYSTSIVAKTGKNHLNEEITTSLLPTGIGERFSQTISNLGHAALLRRCELPL